MCCRRRRYPHRVSVSLRNISRFSKRKRLRLGGSSAVYGWPRSRRGRLLSQRRSRRAQEVSDKCGWFCKYGRMAGSWEMPMRRVHETPRCDVTSRERDFRFFEYKNREASFVREGTMVAQFFSYPRISLKYAAVWRVTRKETGRRNASLFAHTPYRTYVLSRLSDASVSLVTWELIVDKRDTDSFHRRTDVLRNGRAKWEIRRSLLWHDWRLGLLA